MVHGWSWSRSNDATRGAAERAGADALSDLALEPRSRLERVVAGIAGLTAVALLGVLDSLTSAAVSLAVLYVLAVAAVTMYSAATDGLVVAVASTAAWVAGDSAVRGVGVGTYAINGVLRCAALVIVVILVDRLVAAMRAAQRSDQRSRDFLATAAHQLRTPLAGIRASADALLQLGATAEQEPLLGNLAVEAARAGELVGSLLRIARLDQGEGLRPEFVDLRSIAEDAVARVRGRTTTEVRLEPIGRGVGDEVLVLVDVLGTAEVIENLLDNAQRHARSAIRLTIGRMGHDVRLAVSDDGDGLAAGDEQRAFDRFVSLDGRGGSGLGLSIARQLARMQGGDVNYVDGEFVLTLPAASGPGTPDRPTPSR